MGKGNKRQADHLITNLPQHNQGVHQLKVPQFLVQRNGQRSPDISRIPPT